MSSIPILVLRLDGLLQSWGEHSKWDFRDSGSMPTKSAIVGLLGCALGWDRGDKKLVSLSEAIKLAIREDCKGVEMIDFHTVQSKHLLNAQGKHRGKSGEYSTLITNRTYLQNAYFTVAITGPKDLLCSLAHALEKPKWPVYLGRKACVPSRPVLGEFTERYTSLEEAVQELPVDKNIAEKEKYLIEIEADSKTNMQFERQDAVAGHRYFKGRMVVRKIV